ncbi:MAG: response regulator [Polyangiaceae bacterium]|nr:response regulator [Polyangiaceae bacterium]
MGVVCAGGALLAMGFALRNWLQLARPGAALVLALVAAMGLGLAAAARWGAPPRRILDALSAVIAVMVGLVSLLSGGFVAGPLTWGLVVPMVVLVFGDVGQLGFWFVLLLGEFVGIHAYAHANAALWRTSTPQFLPTLIGILVLITLVGVVHQHQRRRHRSEKARLASALAKTERLEALGHLAAGVAHDFNNLLTILQTATDELKNHVEDDSDARRELSAIRYATDRGEALTRQLLLFGSSHAVGSTTFDMREMLRMLDPVLDHLVPASITRHISLPDGRCWVNAEQRAMEQVVVNFVVNARDAMPEGGRLAIELSRRDESVVLTVSDTGTGIAAQVMPHLFEPFFTTKPRGRGTGLGLASAHAVVRRANGQIDVSSEPGAGACFTVTLPLVEAPGAVDPSLLPPELDAERLGVVAVVDDEVAVLRAAGRVLRRRGHTVLTASDGTAALQQILKHDPPVEVLLTDVVMPAMSGAELFHSLSEKFPELRVVYMSGYAEERRVTEDVKLGLADFLPKPFDEASLSRAVASALARRS